ncbi:MAG: 30S ribosomal protein S16 [Candidatus Promineifilaceae bacterium]|nr:30S ribosomal protein S16 [Candidatus Promineifilaceae bacterium]
MLRIRLSRVGKKKQAHFRVVVADIEAPRDGRIVESIGHYTPLTDPSTYKINEGRALYWLSVGAQPTDAVRDLLKKQGTLERLKRLHAGEPLESLVAEYEGEETDVEAAEAEEAAEADDVEEAEEPVAEAAEELPEAVEEAVAEVVGEEE